MQNKKGLTRDRGKKYELLGHFLLHPIMNAISYIANQMKFD